MARKIKDLDELKRLAEYNQLECFVALNGAKSSKDITFHRSKETWYIFHAIDGSEEELTEKEFETTFTYEALEKGALYLYEHQD